MPETKLTCKVHWAHTSTRQVDVAEKPVQPIHQQLGPLVELHQRARDEFHETELEGVLLEERAPYEVGLLAVEVMGRAQSQKNQK